MPQLAAGLVLKTIVQLPIFKYVMIIPSIFSTEIKTSTYLLTYWTKNKKATQLSFCFLGTEI